MTHIIVRFAISLIILWTLSLDRMSAQRVVVGDTNVVPPSLTDRSATEEPFLCGKENFKLPTSLAVPAAHSVSLSWNASTSLSSPLLSGHEGYNLYRQNPDGSCVKVNGEQLLEKTSYVDKSVKGGETYRYAVTAVKKKRTGPPAKDEESKISNVAKLRIPEA